MAKNLFSGLFGKKGKDLTDPTDDPSITEPLSNEIIAPESNSPGDDLTTPYTNEITVTAESGPLAPSPREPDEQSSKEAPTPTSTKRPGLFARLRAGLSKTSSQLSEGVTAIFTKRKLDNETLDEFEDLLITADLGVAAAGRIRAAISADRFDKDVSDIEIRQAVAAEVTKTLTPLEAPFVIKPHHRPHVILMTGVNGAGKTTTIGKLAAQFKDEGLSVMLAAGDTFRAAAVEQLTVWGERTNAIVVRGAIGADAAGLAFDALKDAKAKGVDVLLIDTAGRLQNKRALMDELAKIVRVLKKLDPEAPHDVLLVLDATVGQNALSQTASFQDIAGVTGLVMTKLDGTARGGVLVALADNFSIPIHYIGVGESVEDLQSFNAERFAHALAGLED